MIRSVSRKLAASLGIVYNGSAMDAVHRDIFHRHFSGENFLENPSAHHTVVITGASTGIGKACALRLDQMGWHVFAGVRKERDAAALRAAASDRLRPLSIDVTDSDSIYAAAEEVQSSVDGLGLSGLVNNAGIAVGGPLEFIPIDQLRRQLDVNVTGQLAVTQAFLALLRRAQGRIVNMSSIAGRSATPMLGPYSASKHALEALTDSLRLELRPWGIHVSAVEPGEIDTPIWEKSLEVGKEMLAQLPPQAMELYGPLIDMMLDQVANAGGIPADEVAKSVIHALTDDNPRNRYVVGQDAHIRLWLERLPDHIRDGIIASKLPKYGDT